MTERLGVAVVLVHHLTKASSADGMRRVLGSIAYVGACRANFLFLRDPLDSTGRRVLMLDNGGNMGPPAPTLAYVIDDAGSGPRIVWSDTPMANTVEQALQSQAFSTHDGEQADRLECDVWLRTFLDDEVKPTIDIFKAASAAPFSMHQIKRAKRRIGAVARREGFGPNGQWIWRRHAHSFKP